MCFLYSTAVYRSLIFRGDGCLRKEAERITNSRMARVCSSNFIVCKRILSLNYEEQTKMVWHEKIKGAYQGGEGEKMIKVSPQGRD